MRIVPPRARALIVTSLVGVWTVLTYACTGGIENPALVFTDEAGNPLDPKNVSLPPLCATYKGYDSVKFLADSIIATAKADCHLSQIIDVDDTHLHECLQQFVGSVFQCDGVTFTENQTKDSTGAVCETILGSLKLSSTDWQAFGAFNDDAASQSAAEYVMRSRGLRGDILTGVGVLFAAKEQSVENASVPPGKYTRCATGCGGDACDPDAGPPQDAYVAPKPDAYIPPKEAAADAPTDG